MAIDASGILAEEVGVAVAIQRSDGAAMAGCKGDRERVGVKDGACVTARKVFARDQISLMRCRVAVAEGVVSQG